MGKRRQVNPGELGTPVRFEIETDQGWIIRFTGEEAAEHCKTIDAACGLASARGSMTFPDSLPLVLRARDEHPAFLGRHSCGKVCSAVFITDRTTPDLPEFLDKMKRDNLTIELVAGRDISLGLPSSEYCSCFGKGEA